MFLPNDPLIYLTPLSLITMIASFIQIRKNEEDLKKRQEAVKTEQGKVEAMVESMADGVLMLDPALNLLLINPAAQRLLGLPASEPITTKDVVDRLADKMDLRTKVEQCIRENMLVTLDNLVIGNNVSQLLISPARYEKRVLVGTVVIFHDITSQKELERLREEFTAMMVHELRAPLTVVRGTADLLLRSPDISSRPEGVAMIQTMQSSTGTMLALVNDLLDAAKIEAGKFQIVKTENNLAGIISDRINFFSQLAAPKSINLEVTGTDPNLEGEFDRERITQVLNNLISNALKFTSSGGKIELSAYKIFSPADIHWRFPDNLPEITGVRFPAILVSVSDTGTGIAPDKLPELFSKFKQLAPENNHRTGTGLGLVIAKGIIQSHGGEIFVQSRENTGTTFYFTLPLD